MKLSFENNDVELVFIYHPQNDFFKKKFIVNLVLGLKVCKLNVVKNSGYTLTKNWNYNV